jgi:small redox-active disulfide protein 2
MKIEVIGPGCPFCRKLYQRVREVVDERGIEADVKHVTDLKTAMRYFPMTPVLLVDGRVMHRGKLLPNKEKLAELIEQASSSQ